MKPALSLFHVVTVSLFATSLFAPLPTAAQGEIKPMKVILDTDIGDDVDDAYAVALLVALPNAKLLGVTTAFDDTAKKAILTRKLLNVMGRKDVPVFAGRKTSDKIGRQYDWAASFATNLPKTDLAVGFLKREIERAPGEVTLIAIGPLTNLGDLFTKHPEIKSKIKQIVIMGGAVFAGYNEKPPAIPEWNIKCDPAAARIVYNSGVPLTMAGLEVTSMLKLDHDRQKRLFGCGTPTTDALAALTNLWGNNIPTLFDPMAIAWALGYKFCEIDPRNIVVEDDGLTRIGSGKLMTFVLVDVKKDAFLDWFVLTVGAGGHGK